MSAFVPDPGDLTQDDMHDRAPIPATPIADGGLRCSCGNTDVRIEHEAFAVCVACGAVGLRDQFVKDCQLCGEEFSTKQTRRRRSTRNPDVCLGCARLEELPLTDDEQDALSEAYAAGRTD
jgi:hypothetical protein